MTHAIAHPMVLGSVRRYAAGIDIEPILAKWREARRAKETGYETPLSHAPAGVDAELLGHVRLAGWWPTVPFKEGLDFERFTVALHFFGSGERFDHVNRLLKEKPHLLRLSVLTDQVEQAALVPDVVKDHALPAGFQQVPKTRGKLGKH
jgi:hypothetical protein